MKTEAAKHILQAVRPGDGFFLRNYNMNLYRGCSHGCIYCDSRSVCYKIEDFDIVRAKRDALAILRAELAVKRMPGVVGFGATSDSYNPFEKKELLTRGALELLSKHGFGVGITTKSPLVARDADILQTIARYAPAHVTFSITCAEDVLSKRVEPRVAPSSQRFQAMEALAAAGVLCGVWINPVLPFITDDFENIRSILRSTKAAGGRYAVCFFSMTLREGNREYFYEALDRRFPGVKDEYVRAFGNAYECPSPKARALYPAYIQECGRLGLMHSFSEINALIRASGGATQLSLF